MHVDMGAQLPNSFRSSLREHTVVRIRGFVVVDGERILSSGVEGKAAKVSLVISDDGE